MKRTLFFLILDGIAAVISIYLSFLVYFEVYYNVDYLRLVAGLLPYFISAKLCAFLIFRVYRIIWRYFGIIELFRMIMALAASSLALLCLSLSSPPPGWPFLSVLLSPLLGFPKSIIFMDFTISLVLISLTRVSKRFYREVIREKRKTRKGKRTIILGAGNTGEMIVRDMARQGFSDFYPIGFLDDDRSKSGVYIRGVRIIGGLGSFEQIIGTYDIEAVIIAIPRLDRKALSELYASAKKLNVNTIKIVPRIYDFNDIHIGLKSLEDISVEDLIGRQAVVVNYGEISKFLSGKTVLITGAGGSIGSEIVAQVAGFGPERLVLFEIDETELHDLGHRLKRRFPELMADIRLITGDIRDRIRVSEIFQEYKPQIVFHAAAYKHVPMMEHNPGEAVKVNIFGTYAIAQAAVKAGVEKFIMISTDKAVRPTSVMGATKRVAEHICTAFNYGEGETGRLGGGETGTRFTSVRFGNVLGSRGSVLPLFLEQLKAGGPITITHKDMKRYFMTIPEAVSLVLQASVIGNGGEVLVLDMGEPVNITDMAEQLVRMHGLEPGKDIAIQYVGVRPGEKLFEEILTAEEGTDASIHEKIHIAKNGQAYDLAAIEDMTEEFDAVLRIPSVANGDKVKSILKKYVKYYNEDQAAGDWERERLGGEVRFADKVGEIVEKCKKVVQEPTPDVVLYPAFGKDQLPDRKG
jgi:FlaA1/EpsC-like NDP-sugar epimerase